MGTALRQRIQEDMTDALRARDKARLGAVRLILAAVKQVEVDERVEPLEDGRVADVLRKMLKQRRDSLQKYQEAGRQDLADQEAFEMGIIEAYLPEPFTEAELDQLIDTVLRETGASSLRDMGQVMGQLKSRVQGRADMGVLSARVKQRLARSS